MTNKTILIAAAALGVAAGSAQVRLGWTMDDCQAKWGAPVHSHINTILGVQECIFRTGSPLTVQVEFLDGKVQCIIYTSASRAFLSAISEKSLQLNYPGKWKLFDDGKRQGDDRYVARFRS
jgi:hypothetical protein